MKKIVLALVLVAVVFVAIFSLNFFFLKKGKQYNSPIEYLDYFLPYEAISFTQPNFIQYFGRPTETWQNGLIVNTQDAQIGDYTIHMEKSDRTQSYTCNPNTCGGTLAGKDQYGCDTWSYSKPNLWRCTYYTDCICYTGATTGDRIPSGAASIYEFNSINCPVGVQGTMSYEAGGLSTCGGATVIENWGCAYKYTVRKNNITIDFLPAFTGTGAISRDYGDMRIVFGDSLQFKSYECNWIATKYEILTPTKPFDFQLVATNTSFVQGSPATLQMTITNRWTNSHLIPLLDVCQPTFSGEYCNTIIGTQVQSNRNSITTVNFSIPTEYVTERLTVTPRVNIFFNTALTPFKNINVNCAIIQDANGNNCCQILGKNDGTVVPTDSCKNM